jgi:hypothetical protein
MIDKTSALAYAKKWNSPRTIMSFGRLIYLFIGLFSFDFEKPDDLHDIEVGKNRKIEL